MANEKEVSAKILFEKFDTCIMAKAIIGIRIRAALKRYILFKARFLSNLVLTFFKLSFWRKPGWKTIQKLKPNFEINIKIIRS